MPSIARLAASYRGYLTHDRSAIPLTITLATVVAVWLLVYLLAWATDLQTAQRANPPAHLTAAASSADR
jgi:hypothetical protein